MTIVIGLTGGIGSGKSTVSQYLGEFGAVLIDADKVGHEVFDTGTPAYRDVVNTFGKEVLSPTGEIDRKKLGQIVFTDPAKRERLNKIMWARIWEMIALKIDDARRQNAPAVVVEAFGLIEAGWDKLVDEVWAVVVPAEIVVDRLKNQRGMSKEEVLTRIRSQLSNEERARHALVVIHNDRPPEEIKEEVGKLWKSLLARHRYNSGGGQRGEIKLGPLGY